MTMAIALFFAATMLSDLQDETPEKMTDADFAAESVAATNAPAGVGKTVKITSVRADYDRRDGVIFFDENVVVEDPEFTMHADKLHVFVDQLNQLKRIVVTGHVAITNELKRGYCNRATFVKDIHRIIMFGVPGAPARLVDDSKKRSVVEGSKITFWTDSEQVEVDAPTILLDGGLPAGSIREAAAGGDKQDFSAKTDKEEKKKEE